MEIKNELRDKILDNAVNGIYVYDLLKGTNIYINYRYTELTGYTLSELNNMSEGEFFSLFHPEDQDAIARHMEQVTHSLRGEVIDIEYRFKKKDGSWIWCFSRDRIIERSEVDGPVQFMGSFMDITARKKMELQLKAANSRLISANKELEQFAYIASHDLQEPLKTVQSFVDLFENKYKEQLDEKGLKFLSFISQAANRMSTLVKGLLDYSRIGREEAFKMVDLQQVFEEIIQDLNSTITATNTNIYFSTLPMVYGLETELRMLFQNLISNAIKFRKPEVEPKIVVDIKREQEYWVFLIEDNGIGIEEKYFERIFVIFQRLHNKKDYQGTGIGLAHCRKIVELHHGKIWVESKLGEGSTFFIKIPVRKI